MLYRKLCLVPFSYITTWTFCDLNCNKYNTILQALCGTEIVVPTLAEKKVPLNLKSEVIKPTTTKRLQGHGLPFAKEPSRRGDLLISFDIKFPEVISPSVRDILYDTLP